jgi:antirestriction protein ArdC
MEELVAELGSAFLCADLDLTPEVREDHAAYIEHWLKVLKQDKRAIFTAAAHAQRAVDFLHSLQPQPAPEPDPAPGADADHPEPDPAREDRRPFADVPRQFDLF